MSAITTTTRIDMDDKGRLSLARVLSPQQRGGTYFARVEDNGTITLEPVAVVSAGEAAWLNEYLSQFREEIEEGAAKTHEELVQHLVTE